MVVTVCLNPVIQRTLLFRTVVPGNVNRACQSVTCASGKGINVSRVLCQLEVPVRHITQIGGRHAPWFLSLAEKDNIPVVPVETSADIRFCTTVIATDSGCVTELVEEGNTVEPALSDLMVHTVCKAVDQSIIETPADNCPVLVISGSKAPGFSDALFPSLVEYALRRNIPVVCDCRGADLAATLERCRDFAQDLLYIKPNEDEFKATFAPNSVQFDLEVCLSDVCSRYHCSAVITRGTLPTVTYYSGEISSVPVESAGKAVNTTGCGDAFTAGFAAAIAEHQSFDNAVAHGMMCGCRNAGTLLPGSLI